MEKSPSLRNMTSSRLGPLLDRVGTVVRGKWTIGPLLGAGGMAAVYEAKHRNGRRAALKVMHRLHATETDLVERFLREGWLANQVEHPGRVECFDDDTTEQGEPFLIMELLEGETLDALWKRNNRMLSASAALSVAEKLLDFLTACHGAGIIHRDLKPANVFLARGGQVKVLDFGVAHHRAPRAAETRMGIALGTPSFMAPEQARGRSDQLDARADLFAVGALLFALLSGKRLHEGKGSDEALIAAATERAPSLASAAPDLAKDVVAIVDKALSWEIEARWSDAEEMRRAVLSVLHADRDRAPVQLTMADDFESGNLELELSTRLEEPSPTRPEPQLDLPPPRPELRSDLELAVGTSIQRVAEEEERPSQPLPRMKLWTPIRRGSLPPGAPPSDPPRAPSIPPETPEAKGPPPPLGRPLDRVTVPHIFAQIVRRGFSGTLVVTEATGATHALYYEQGAPVRGRTDVRGKSILSVLVNVPPGSTFALLNGVDSLGPGAQPAPSDALSAILAAVREWADEARIDRIVSSMKDGVLRLHPHATPQRFSVTSEEKEILESIRAGWLSLGDLLEAYPAREGVVRRLVYTLALTRHLDLGQQGAWPLGVPEQPGRTEPPLDATIPDPVSGQMADHDTDVS